MNIIKIIVLTFIIFNLLGSSLSFSNKKNLIRRNPFLQTQVKSLPLHKTRVKQSLEYFPLKELKFVGILQDSSQLWALIEDSKHKIHKIICGAYLGQHSGQVKSISDKGLIIEESLFFEGSLKKLKRVLKLST